MTRRHKQQKKEKKKEEKYPQQQQKKSHQVRTQKKDSRPKLTSVYVYVS